MAMANSKETTITPTSSPTRISNEHFCVVYSMDVYTVRYNTYTYTLQPLFLPILILLNIRDSRACFI